MCVCVCVCFVCDQVCVELLVRVHVHVTCYKFRCASMCVCACVFLCMCAEVTVRTSRPCNMEFFIFHKTQHKNNHLGNKRTKVSLTTNTSGVCKVTSHVCVCVCVCVCERCFPQRNIQNFKTNPQSEKET